MSEDIDTYITRVNKILTDSSRNSITTLINQCFQEKPDSTSDEANKPDSTSNEANKPDSTSSEANKPDSTNSEANKENEFQLPAYNTFDEIESLCKRAIILYTKGIYVPPPNRHACKNKRKKPTGSRKPKERESKILKTTFGSGRVGVSCESFGVKNCSCCPPFNNIMDNLFYESMCTSPMTRPTSPIEIVVSPPPNKDLKKPFSNEISFIDLTKPSTSGFTKASRKNLDNSVICIDDSSLDNTIDDDSNLEIDLFKENQTSLEPQIDNNSTPVTKNENVNLKAIKTEKQEPVRNFADIVNVADYIDLVTADFDADEMINYEDNIDENLDSNTNTIIKTEDTDEMINKNTLNENTNIIIKTEIPDTPLNFSNVENIQDYIDLVTEDYDEEEMRKYEEEFVETIKKTNLETLSEAYSNTENNLIENPVTPKPIPNENNQTNNLINLPNNFIENSVTSKPIPNENNLINLPNNFMENSVTSKLIPNENNSIVETVKTPVTSSAPELSCPICLEELIGRNPMSTICGHVFCGSCIKEAIKKTKTCPNCRKKLKLKDFHPIYLG